MQRQCVLISDTSDIRTIKSELFYLQSSIDCLARILNDQAPYPGIDIDEERFSIIKIETQIKSLFFNFLQISSAISNIS